MNVALSLMMVAPFALIVAMGLALSELTLIWVILASTPVLPLSFR